MENSNENCAVHYNAIENINYLLAGQAMYISTQGKNHKQK